MTEKIEKDKLGTDFFVQTTQDGLIHIKWTNAVGILTEVATGKEILIADYYSAKLPPKSDCNVKQDTFNGLQRGCSLVCTDGDGNINYSAGQITDVYWQKKIRDTTLNLHLFNSPGRTASREEVMETSFALLTRAEGHFFKKNKNRYFYEGEEIKGLYSLLQQADDKTYDISANYFYYDKPFLIIVENEYKAEVIIIFMEPLYEIHTNLG